jgi:hypothetical protein
MKDTMQIAFDNLMNHEFLQIILNNVFRYDLHQSVSQMIHCPESVEFVWFMFVLSFYKRYIFFDFSKSLFSEKKNKKNKFVKVFFLFV